MGVTIVLQSPPPPPRLAKTGWNSFDYSIGGAIPGRSMIEIAGKGYNGKTTFASSLAGRLVSDVGLVDLEGEGTGEYIGRILGASSPGWEGTLWVAPQVDDDATVLSDEDQISAGVEWLGEKDSRALLLDSISMVSPIQEQEGAIGDANMGRRARIMSTAYKQLRGVMRKWSDSYFIAINHVYPNLGTPGSDTSGGQAPKNFSSFRFDLRANRDLETGVWIIEGLTKKRRASAIGKVYPSNWRVVMIEGEGVSANLTAVIDCQAFNLTEGDRTIKLGGKSYGYFSKLVEKRGEEDLFSEFHKAAANYVEEELGRAS